MGGPAQDKARLWLLAYISAESGQSAGHLLPHSTIRYCPAAMSSTEPVTVVLLSANDSLNLWNLLGEPAVLNHLLRRFTAVGESDSLVC